MDKEVSLKFKVSFILPIVIILLTACDDGDVDALYSDIDGKNSPEVPSNSSSVELSAFTISTNNLEKTSSIAMSAIFNNLALNTSDIFTHTEVEEAAAQSYFNHERAISKQLKRSVTSGEGFSENINASATDCKIAGNTTTTFDLQDPFTISIDDSVMFESENCNDGQTITNGKFLFKFTQFTDFVDLNNYTTLGLDMIFAGYSVEVIEQSKTVTISSIYSLLITKDLYSQQVEITSPVLGVRVNDYMQLLQNLVIKKRYTKNTNIETMSASSNLMDTALFGELTITTLDDFEFYGQESDAPTSGSMKIMAEDNSSIVITVLNVSDVQLAADFDGDDVIDETRVVTWESLVSH